MRQYLQKQKDFKIKNFKKKFFSIDINSEEIISYLICVTTTQSLKNVCLI